MAANIYRESLIEPKDRIITSLDHDDWDAALSHLDEIKPHVGMGKTNSLHTREGTDYAVKTLASNGLYSMIDGKYHDIAETVYKYTRDVTLSGASLITVHTSGALAMLQASIAGRDKGREQTHDAFRQSAIERLGGILGVTVLTSLDSDDCKTVFDISPDDKNGIKKKVVEFTCLALEAGLDGIVCSSLELETIRQIPDFDDLLTVVPGITPEFAKQAKDQKRTTTARQAISSGADFIVVGRAINNAHQYGMTRTEAAEAVENEVKEGLGV